MKKLAFIGLGNMGKAIASGLIKSGAIASADVFGYDPYTEGLNAFCAQTGINACASARKPWQAPIPCSSPSSPM